MSKETEEHRITLENRRKQEEEENTWLYLIVSIAFSLGFVILIILLSN